MIYIKRISIFNRAALCLLATGCGQMPNTDATAEAVLTAENSSLSSSQEKELTDQPPIALQQEIATVKKSLPQKTTLLLNPPDGGAGEQHHSPGNQMPPPDSPATPLEKPQNYDDLLVRLVQELHVTPTIMYANQKRKVIVSINKCLRHRSKTRHQWRGDHSPRLSMINDDQEVSIVSNTPFDDDIKQEEDDAEFSIASNHINTPRFFSSNKNDDDSADDTPISTDSNNTNTSIFSFPVPVVKASSLNNIFLRPQSRSTSRPNSARRGNKTRLPGQKYFFNSRPTLSKIPSEHEREKFPTSYLTASLSVPIEIDQKERQSKKINTLTIILPDHINNSSSADATALMQLAKDAATESKFQNALGHMQSVKSQLPERGGNGNKMLLFFIDEAIKELQVATHIRQVRALAQTALDEAEQNDAWQLVARAAANILTLEAAPGKNYVIRSKEKKQWRWLTNRQKYEEELVALVNKMEITTAQQAEVANHEKDLADVFAEKVAELNDSMNRVKKTRESTCWSIIQSLRKRFPKTKQQAEDEMNEFHRAAYDAHNGDWGAAVVHLGLALALTDDDDIEQQEMADQIKKLLEPANQIVKLDLALDRALYTKETVEQERWWLVTDLTKNVLAALTEAKAPWGMRKQWQTMQTIAHKAAQGDQQAALQLLRQEL